MHQIQFSLLWGLHEVDMKAETVCLEWLWSVSLWAWGLGCLRGV